MAKAKTKTKVQPKTEPTPEQVELSKEELNARRDEITNYYSENIVMKVKNYPKPL